MEVGEREAEQVGWAKLLDIANGQHVFTGLERISRQIENHQIVGSGCGERLFQRLPIPIDGLSKWFVKNIRCTRVCGIHDLHTITIWYAKWHGIRL